MSPRNNHSLSTFVVGISGHRDLHPAARPQLREAVSAILEQLAERLPDCELRIMAGMAAGADLLVVQTGLELGLGVDALLPMPLPQYAADFDGESFVLLQTLLAHPRVRCRELALGASGQEAAAAIASPSRDAGYSTLSQSLVHGSSMLIALWDGQPTLLPGGTADTVLRYLGVRTDRNKDDERVQFADHAGEPDLPARLVYWIPTARATAAVAPGAGDRSPCFLAGLGDNTLQCLPGMPRRLDVHPRSLNAYHRDGQRLNDGEAVPVPGDS